MFTFRRLSIAFALAGLAASATGCAKDPSKEVVAAAVAEPEAAKPAEEAAKPGTAPTALEPGKIAPVAAAVAPSAPAGALALTGSIHAIGSKVTGSHDLDLKGFTGTVALKDGKPEGGQLNFQVPMAQFTTDAGPMTDKLTGHLKSPDFFDVEKFPTATFASTEIQAGGENGATHSIKGNLTLRGVTKEVTFPATLAVTGKDITGKAEFSINRKDFGIVYAGKADDLIRDGVVLKIDVKATQP
jgi:polyisoprenoid-binding protein YceI